MICHSIPGSNKLAALLAMSLLLFALSGCSNSAVSHQNSSVEKGTQSDTKSNFICETEESNIENVDQFQNEADSEVVSTSSKNISSKESSNTVSNLENPQSEITVSSDNISSGNTSGIDLPFHKWD